MDLCARRASPEPGERGIVVVLGAATILFVLGMAVLVVDVGILLLGRSDVSMAVDAAALAGAQELPAAPSLAEAVALEYINLNIRRELYGLPVTQVTFPEFNVIQVTSTIPMPALFSRVFGFDELGAAASAEATRYDPDVALILDRSGSMCRDSHGELLNCPEGEAWEPFNSIQNAAKGFVDELGGTGTIALISYSTTATLDVPSTFDKTALKDAIDALVPGGNTDIAASVVEAIDELLLLSGPNPKMVVLLTDGVPNTVDGVYVGEEDTAPGENLLAAAHTASEAGIPIYSIAYGELTNLELMRQIAEASTGKFFHVPDEESLTELYSEIADTAQIRLTNIR